MLQPTTSDLSNRPECLASAIMRFSLRWEESWVSIDLIWDCDSTQLLTVIFIFTIMISTEMLKCHLKCKCSSAIWLLGQDCIVDISILHSTTPHQISPILLLLLLLSHNYLLCIKSELSRERIKPSNIILIYNTYTHNGPFYSVLRLTFLLSSLALQLIWSLELLFVSFESNF